MSKIKVSHPWRALLELFTNQSMEIDPWWLKLIYAFLPLLPPLTIPPSQIWFTFKSMYLR